MADLLLMWLIWWGRHSTSRPTTVGAPPCRVVISVSHSVAVVESSVTVVSMVVPAKVMRDFGIFGYVIFSYICILWWEMDGFIERQ